MLVIQEGCWLAVHCSSPDSCSLTIPVGVWKSSLRKFGSDGSDGDEDEGDGSESEESDDDSGSELGDDSGSEGGDMIDAEGLAEEADDGAADRAVVAVPALPVDGAEAEVRFNTNHTTHTIFYIYIIFF